MTTVGARTTPTIDWIHPSTVARQIVRATVLTVTLVANIVAVGFVVARFVAGTSPTQPQPIWLVAAGVSLAVLALLLRVVCLGGLCASPGAQRSANDWLCLTAPSVFVWLGLIWLGMLGGSIAVLAAAMACGIAQEVWAASLLWQGYRQRTPAPPAAAPVVTPSTTLGLERGPGQDIESIDDVEESVEDEWAPPGVNQQLTRGVDPERGEYVLGILRAEFLPSQRNETLHIAFCPPLRSVPRIQLQPIDGPPVTATVAMAEVFGARFELRLNRAWEEPQQVVLQFEALEA